MSSHCLPSTETILRESAQAAALGAMIGGMSALPAAYAAACNGDSSREEAMRRVLRAGAHTAIATGVGAAAATLVGSNNFLRLAAMMTVGGVTLHALSGGSATCASSRSAPEIPQNV